ncbi:DUF4082 domain-containing protein [Micromonospora sp. WMMD812]|uniref:DUF4082 domain-containing protein n=1 Tax=Micromonospora sp. WMMD812 TaxID=3015152 RepID=UPI00248C129D|nr:DUF4082 domain-containing protein [Micromonospora sp. WMMD812]WBB69605.1 DUF4082 domain-containing protein [Micromonospora sp. WMMD812]
MAALVILASTMVVAGWATTDRSGTYSFFGATNVSHVPVDPDTNPVELGLRFTSSRAGTLTAVRFLKAAGAGGSHPVTVWSARGQKLATAMSGNESRSGWQEVTLPTPVRIEAGQVYVVSYHTSRYRATQDYFERPAKSGPLSSVDFAGVYKYGPTGFPSQTWKKSNYWVDVVFAPTATGTSSPRPTASPSRTTGPTASPSGSPNPTPTRDLPPLALPRVPWEGGPGYYGGYAPARGAGWTDPAFFPIGVWQESVVARADAERDRSVGLNTYVAPTDNSDLGLVAAAGMHVIGGSPRQTGPATVGWSLSDEVDMWGGPGSAAWTGNYPGRGAVCDPPDGRCGYTVQEAMLRRFPADGGLRYANYGKGVMFWETDTEASRFVNSYTNVVSNDIYWYTDPGVCNSPSEGPGIGVRPEDCRRAANYGRTMDRMRQLDGLDGKRQPIYAFVEVGHPFSENDAPTITGDQIAGAVLNSLIHEARGVLYFNHNFGGPCLSQHVLRDSCGAAVRPTVTELNRRISVLAPVLNTQSYQWRFNPSLDTMLKAHGDSYYVFAMPGRTGGTGTQRLTLPAGMSGSRAEVLFENRTVPISGGALQDTFARESTYHIYKITP